MAAAPVKIERHESALSLRGQTVEKFTLTNDKLKVSISTLGASITSLHAPDANGEMGDVVLGYPDHEKHAQLSGGPYFGCIVGRVANRIANGKFEIDGKQYALEQNNGPNHLHGGHDGFDKRIWVPQVLPDGIQLNLTSPDGDQGYPGTVSVTAEYRLIDDGIELKMRARSDAATPINLAQHSYFNLGGHASGTILGHEIQFSADSYTPVDANSIPTKQVAPCGGTEFDFSQPRAIGEAMAVMAAARGIPAIYDPSKRALLVNGADAAGIPPKEAGGSQSPIPLGFDHNFVVTGACDAAPGTAPSPRILRHVATVREPASGRVLTVESDAPGVQFYTGNYLGPSTSGKPAGGGGGGAETAYPQHAGFCLETQHFPDSVNYAANDPDSAFARGAAQVLRPGEEYAHTVIYRFAAAAATAPATAQ